MLSEVCGSEGARSLRYFFLIGLMVPAEATVVPMFYGELHLGLINKYPGAFLPLTGIAIGLGSFWMRAFFVSIPRDLFDAAKVDGATSWTTLRLHPGPHGQTGDLYLGCSFVPNRLERLSRVPHNAGDTRSRRRRKWHWRGFGART